MNVDDIKRDFEIKSLQYEKQLLTNLIQDSQSLIEESLASYSQQIMASIEEFSQNIESLAAGIDQIASAADQLRDTVTEQKDTMNSIAASQQEIDKNSRQGLGQVKQLDSSIGELNKLSTLLKQMIADNLDIADQLHLLSINGSIEAARAGSLLGAPFKVVAQEISSLSSKATKIITEQEHSVNSIISIISSLTEVNDETVTQITRTSDTISETVSFFDTMMEKMEYIASSSEELASIVHQFTTAIEQMRTAIGEISSSVQDFYSNLQTEFRINKQVTNLTTSISQIAETSSCLEEAAGKITKFLSKNFTDAKGNSSLILTRIFLSLPGEDLDQAAADFVRNQASPVDRYLCLMGTSGKEPAWNDRRQSKNHLAIPLPSRQEELDIMPMLAEMFRRMDIKYSRLIRKNVSSAPAGSAGASGGSGDTRGLGAGAPKSYEDGYEMVEGYMLVEEAEGSPFIPAQNDFVKAYGVKSEIGYGGFLPSGAVFTAFIFSSTPIDRHFADKMKILSAALQQAFLRFDLSGAYWCG